MKKHFIDTGGFIMNFTQNASFNKVINDTLIVGVDLEL